jgi:hypothetical protein
VKPPRRLGLDLLEMLGNGRSEISEGLAKKLEIFLAYKIQALGKVCGLSE